VKGATLVVAALLALFDARSAVAQRADSSAAAGVALQAAEPLGPGDIVRLKIWREPDHSGDFMVDASGSIVAPMLGPVSVASLQPDSVVRLLTASYQKYLTHSSIEVTLLRRVTVLGAVRTPGLYPVDPTMKISDVLAVAGGATTEGDPDRMELRRDGQRLQVEVNERTRVGELPIHSGDELFVPERRWTTRNVTIIATTFAAAASILIAYLTRSR
jgi:polysaccharide export outer membrane protein